MLQALKVVLLGAIILNPTSNGGAPKLETKEENNSIAQ